MNNNRRRLLKLVPFSGLALLAGCDESDEDKVARVQRVLEAQKQAAGPINAEPARQAEQAKLEAEELNKKLILFACANLADPFQRLQSGLMGVAARQLDECLYQAVDAVGDAETQTRQLAEALAKHR
ncbi:MAG: hypothetical protein JWO94_959, partial [Verrucomicrobiaceae bacterium]|nr:hypothetical protein [Verrucomicrobiaceae bacterium]